MCAHADVHVLIVRTPVCGGAHHCPTGVAGNANSSANSNANSSANANAISNECITAPLQVIIKVVFYSLMILNVLNSLKRIVMHSNSKFWG